MPTRPLEFEDLNQQFYDLIAQNKDRDFTIQISSEHKSKCWDKYTQDQNLAVYVYNDEDHGIIGVASIVTSPKIFLYNESFATIQQIVVDKNFQSSNIGVSLVTRCINHSKKMKCSKVICACGTKNVKFYEQCGFNKCSYLMEKVL